MTTSRRGGSTRASSSRAQSVVGDIRKKREKAYKVETSTQLATKKKLNLNTSFNRRAPSGYSFLPVGTQDLAARCKELSRQRGFPVDIVNSVPTRKNETDPNKMSHHVHRIGYHFRSEVIDQASSDLRYVNWYGRLVREADIQAQVEQSRIAEIMRRNGLQPRKVEQETPEQVRACIKELFPATPDADVDNIFRHAWEKGSGRVGTASNMDLPRRVQLATSARIRHKYTDYDQLLRAFDWSYARAEVEPHCLRKLIEWRGENATEDDGVLEEIVRETIVIDDDSDDDVGMHTAGSEADDEDSDNESVKFVSERIAVGGDFRPESVNEPGKQLFGRPRAYVPRTIAQDDLARQKIAAARQSMRSHGAASVINASTGPYTNGVIGSGATVPAPPAYGARSMAPNTVVVDGQIYYREGLHTPTEAVIRTSPSRAQVPVVSQPYRLQSQPAPPQQVQYGTPTHIGGAPQPDQVLPSIELPPVPVPAYQPASYSAMHSNNALSHDYYPAEKRRRLDPPNATHPNGRDYPARPTNIDRSLRRPHGTLPAHHQIVDLTTPERIPPSHRTELVNSVRREPLGYDGYVEATSRPIHKLPYDHHALPAHHTETLRPHYQPQPIAPEPYDPNSPLLHLPPTANRAYAPHLMQQQGVDMRQQMAPQVQSQNAFYPPQDAYSAYPPPLAMPAYQEHGAAGTYYVSPLRPPNGYEQTPQPVHGAPAPVQQMYLGEIRRV